MARAATHSEWAGEFGGRNSSAVLTAAASTAIAESRRALAEGSAGVDAGSSLSELPPAMEEYSSPCLVGWKTRACSEEFFAAPCVCATWLAVSLLA